MLSIRNVNAITVNEHEWLEEMRQQNIERRAQKMHIFAFIIKEY